MNLKLWAWKDDKAPLPEEFNDQLEAASGNLEKITNKMEKAQALHDKLVKLQAAKDEKERKEKEEEEVREQKKRELSLADATMNLAKKVAAMVPAEYKVTMDQVLQSEAFTVLHQALEKNPSDLEQGTITHLSPTHSVSFRLPLSPHRAPGHVHEVIYCSATPTKG